MQDRPNLGEPRKAARGGTSSMPLTVPLHLVGSADRPLVGGKAANLGLMIRAALPVPAGYCVSWAAFHQFFEACSQRAEASRIMSRVPTAQPHEAAQLSDALLTCFQECALSTRVQEALLAAWRARGEAREYAVRSGATVEDAPDCSFAGQFDSRLNVRGMDSLLSALRKCWLSLFATRALAYFAREKLPMSDSAMATWQGIAAIPGVVTGRARVILRANDHEHLLPGEILVAPFTDPAWTPYFVTAAAVVMDQGGILSHGSIVAREYGLACVTNVGSATKHIQTGDMIRVDGDRGEVTLLK